MSYEDKLYNEAVALVLADQKPSTSYIQRRLRVSYSTASALMLRMEQASIVTPPSVLGKREIVETNSVTNKSSEREPNG